MLTLCMQNRELGEDKSLLLKVAGGDQRAFRLIFDAYSNRVFTYAFRYLKSKELSEEIVQEVFVKIWVKRDGLPEIGNFGGFIRTVTNNLTLDALRKRALDYKTINEGKHKWSDQDNATEEDIMLKDSRAYMAMAIDQLPKQQKLVYQMCYIEGLKQKDVAKKLNISPLTVKVHLREAVKTLKAHLKDGNSLPLISLVLLGICK
ncbi:RNA polymerase sigma-70 factor, ECF subfamily [Chitinophaga ginsengisegetis]|uniref:RNA polymerase sigma-70 factor, ECF subfamily n=2 Tax=Chitinophagaceae TaxID=563835 RepID=A0A1T5N5U1_9BACT|nr:RNA polymerase sigma-70 factor, ECF subfamily [Chitinophaga ginsengisegetis]